MGGSIPRPRIARPPWCLHTYRALFVPQMEKHVFILGLTKMKEVAEKRACHGFVSPPALFWPNIFAHYYVLPSRRHHVAALKVLSTNFPSRWIPLVLYIARCPFLLHPTELQERFWQKRFYGAFGGDRQIRTVQTFLNMSSSLCLLFCSCLCLSLTEYSFVNISSARLPRSISHFYQNIASETNSF